ncbi:MAG: hypothetical protein NTY02_12575 [Acidobacteria bacterium]|nr:hypothetical protein [Acidobacteriota bacterium]
MRFLSIGLALVVAASVGACSEKTSTPTTPTSPTVPVAPTLTKPAPDTPENGQQLDTLRPTLTVSNGTSNQSGTKTYEFQISDNSNFTLTGEFNAWFAVTTSTTGVAEGSGKTSFTPAQDLQPTTLFYWRARMTQGTTTSDWSDTRSFKAKLVGYSRPGELYDPLIFGETVGERIGSTTFIAAKGIRLDANTSNIRYRLPQTVTAGEYSMDVEGLKANASGDKAKVFGMQQGTSDFISDPYRVDIQYRGTTGAPPNAITWRVLYGSATDTSVRYEPDTTTRFNSVYLLDGATKYHWKATWGSDFRLVVRTGGVTGPELYNYGLPTPKGTYSPNPHTAYLGAPVGTSGAESASIPGTIYSNVWLGTRPRPTSLGSALGTDR